MSSIIYKDYTQATLDAEYDNQGKVANFMSYVQEWTALNETTRHDYPDRLSYCYDEPSGQLLDIIYPTDKDGPCPAQVFFHGGYWKALSRENFTFVARAFAEHGIATVIVDYELIPNVSMENLVHQCRLSLAFLYKHAVSLGLDADNLHISGHSAGGHLTAMCLGTDWQEIGQDLPAQIIKSGVGISGLYNLLPIRLSFLQKDLNLPLETAARMSPVHLPEPTSGRLHLVVGGKEGDEYHAQSDGMHHAWPDTAIAPVSLRPYNHFSIISSLADPTSYLATYIRTAMGLP